MKKFYLLIVATIATIGCMAQTKQKVLCGNLIASDGTIPVGIYAFSLDNDELEMERIIANPEIKASNGGTIVGGELHFINRNSDRDYVYHRFDTKTWQRIGNAERLEGDFKVGDFAYDETTNRFWAYFDEEWPNGVHTYSRFGYADAQTKEVTILREDEQVKREILAVCMDGESNVYAMDPLARIWKIDKTTGEATVSYRLGMTYWMGEGHYSDTNFSMVFDDDNQCFYITLIPSDNPQAMLLHYDIASESVTKLCDLGHDIEFGCLWLTDEMPDAISEINAERKYSDRVYAIDGKVINKAEGTKGIYIKDGKKFIK